MQPWRLVKSPPSDAFTNMAVDEAIFKAVSTKNSPPTIRFYTWSPPAVSIGYFQNSLKDIDVVACREMGMDVVRRLTGGRAVLHDKELTYSIMCADGYPGFPESIHGTYKVISYCLVKGLNILGINASLTPLVRKEEKASPSACFTSMSHYEITVDGCKLVGSAQRRERGTFLQHGSILLDFDRERLEKVLPESGNLSRVTYLRRYLQTDTAELINSLVRGFEEYLGISFSEGPLSPEEIALSKRYMEEKYSRSEWNFKRPSLNHTPHLVHECL